MKKYLGEGGMGKVYLCSAENNMPFALKFYDNTINAAKEFGLFSRLNNKYISRAIEMDDACDLNISFIVMEYIEGINLEQLIKLGEVPEKNIIGMTIIFLRLIMYLHSKGFVLSDIKTQNIMIDKKNSIIKLVDIGGITKIGSGIKEFTPQYDRASWNKGPRHADEKYDQYGLGILLINLCLRKKLYPGKDDINKIIKEISYKSRNIGKIVCMCLSNENINAIYKYAYNIYNEEKTGRYGYIDFLLIMSFAVLFALIIFFYR